MAKLTGQKKLEFLKRMAKGRKKASRGNPKKKTAAKKKNATRKRKPAKKRNAARGKLTGAKKAEFLRRMARGRKKATRGNAKRKTAKKRNAGLGSIRKTKKELKQRYPGKSHTAGIRDRKAGKSFTKGHGTRKKYTRKADRIEAIRKGHYTHPQAGNPTGRRRRNSEAGADAMYESFHGKAPARTLSYEEEINYHAHYAELGKLIELQIDLDSANRKYPFTQFGDCLVVSTTDGENIYLIGGDQKVDLANLDIGGAKDLVELGPCGYIAYRTEKHQFHDFAPRTYYHHFGEENGVKPTLCYDRLNRKLYFSGGDYHVKREGITN